MKNYIVERSLNNNVIIATYNNEEVILFGKGIGFNKKNGDIVNQKIDKVFILSSKDQERYTTLLNMTNDTVIKAILDVINEIKIATEEAMNSQILVSLTDHIIFALKRLEDGIVVHNPFMRETESLYPKEFQIATQVVQMLNDKLNVKFPENETGFITLHIHSAISNHTIGEINMITEVVSKAIHIIEHDLAIQVNESSIVYSRFVRHISFAVERVMKNDEPPHQRNLEKLLKIQYPKCYNIAIKIVKMMQVHLKKPVYESELVYLTMHIQQFNIEVNDV